MFTIQCPHCGKDQRVQEHWGAGQTAQCSGCGGEIPIPDSPPSPPEAEAPSTLASGTAPPIDPGQAQPLESGPLATSGLAVTSLILALIGCIPPLGIVGLVLGIIAINRIDNPANRLKGRGIALAGAIIGGVATVLLVLIGILLPTLGAARKTALRMQNNSRVRDIHQAMVQYAQGNDDYFPGLGAVDDPTVEGRLQILLDGSYFKPEYLLSPVDSGKFPAIAGTLTTNNYSFSLLQIASPGGRRKTWAGELNYEAPVISDRNTGSGPGSAARSIHSSTEWRGSVAYNDNHTLFETSNVLHRRTRYGSVISEDDDLFAPAGNDDAYMIYSGQ